MQLTSFSHKPERTVPQTDEKRFKLHENVVSALSTIQIGFQSTINVQGIDATDLFSMNTLLGSAIEVQVVEALRSMRSVWDPEGDWVEYDFNRYPQSFPDVRLEKCSGDQAPAIGIELKSWYLLSKEAEPSFRFRTTAAACGPYDLVAIVPWSLSDVLSGTPVVHAPFIDQARYVADMRNYYWLNLRVGGNPGKKDWIEVPEGDDVHPYPPGNVVITDKPLSDSGGNFGRVGRVHDLTGDWTKKTLGTLLAGIPARDWIGFLKAHTETATICQFDEGLSTDTDLKELADAVAVLQKILRAMGYESQ